jgi:hypothetical protein
MCGHETIYNNQIKYSKSLFTVLSFNTYKFGLRSIFKPYILEITTRIAGNSPPNLIFSEDYKIRMKCNLNYIHYLYPSVYVPASLFPHSHSENIKYIFFYNDIKLENE